MMLYIIIALLAIITICAIVLIAQLWQIIESTNLIANTLGSWDEDYGDDEELNDSMYADALRN